ncbi:MAG: SpoIIE family protein phosphatase [Candidatus Muiribacteriota bacterium]
MGFPSSYKHIDIFVHSKNHYNEKVCGDYFISYKENDYTFFVLADGLGHGVKANIYAQLFASRIIRLSKEGFSLRQAVQKAVETNRKSKGYDLPYAAFTAGKILNNGDTVTLSYHAPPPLLITGNKAVATKKHTIELGGEPVEETICYLDVNDAILLNTDGITQAGIGKGLIEGWSVEEICDFIETLLYQKINKVKIPKLIVEQAYKYSDNIFQDDTTSVLLKCREGKIINILSGPPQKEEDDYKIINKFISMQGVPVICGDTTAKIAARVLNKEIKIEENASLIAPPRLFIDGIYLVTEGAVTLNQAYNVLGEDISGEEENASTLLCKLLEAGDKINFIIGKKINKGHKKILFKQRGIMPREKILSLLAEKLKKMGKIVSI